MANVTECNISREIPQKSQNQSNFETLDKSSVSTLKRNPKLEFCKTDLLKLLTYLEGELQARDIVIATLKSEKIKQYLFQNRHHSIKDNNDPVAALQRDNFATIDHSKNSSEMCLLVNHQLNSLENLVIQQRRSQARVARVLKEAEIRHRKEIELEIQNRKKYEKEYLKLNEILVTEKTRHKQIVLFLLAERKKIIMKYVEERKRSEDLAQILAEEKGRVDAMAEGLEEESKKSLQMEAELEKHFAQFYVETQQLKLSLSKQEKRSKELEVELEKNQKENLLLRQQLSELRSQHDKNMLHTTVAMTVATPSSMSSSTEAVNSSTVNAVSPGLLPMMTSITKVVQPTATVSSVPVSGPMTGIARSVSPGHHVRYVMYAPISTNPVNSGKGDQTMQHVMTTTSSIQDDRKTVPANPAVRSATIANSPHPKLSASPIAKTLSGGGEQVHVNTVRKAVPIGRGVPPPVPPNKPIIPPKKEGILNRKIEVVAENSQVRGSIMKSVKVKLQSDKAIKDDQIRTNSVADNPG